jgi:hypothetical protein
MYHQRLSTMSTHSRQTQSHRLNVDPNSRSMCSLTKQSIPHFVYDARQVHQELFKTEVPKKIKVSNLSEDDWYSLMANRHAYNDPQGEFSDEYYSDGVQGFRFYTNT